MPSSNVTSDQGPKSFCIDSTQYGKAPKKGDPQKSKESCGGSVEWISGPRVAGQRGCLSCEFLLNSDLEGVVFK